ncbi:putative UDP-glucuronosyl/UDP-glucosyltransferase, UDP-glycosyltransferase family [Helianthus annuus]|nr:putative UDP-glucuronosyl/UDP-glucosyltransferase, UDP-glycosyltransferase family [Helianthus annuus]KAJ0883126.1 putative UDP-glucuronosyl/UDP-glucosyltransferase, UDP-glycosyltransferase family [Helianthus annuus]
MEAMLSKHIIMLPFMAQGHLIPFLELAHKILDHNPNFTITIANTPLNINYLGSAIANRPSRIHLKSLPFNSSDHGLPPNSENTDGLSSSQIVTLLHASTALEAPFRRFISDLVSSEGSPRVCVISDVFMGWANGVAKSFGFFHYTFTTCGAYGTTAYCSIWLNFPHRNLVDGGSPEEFVVPGFPESCRFTVMQLNQYVRAADGKDEGSRFYQKQISLSLESNGWLCNTVEEVETLGLEVLRNYVKLPVWCIGPLIPSKMLKKNLDSDTSSGISGQRSGKQPGIQLKKCMEWLDSHPTGSVLYISFGSQNTITETQMMELAKGLEESNKPFIWVIRPPIGFDLKGDFRPEWLPFGFEDRIGKQGLMVYEWAPQLEILCHRSTGAFLSHCGWNSVTESLSQGVPLIGWPLAGEQAYNAKMLVEEMGVCVVLTRWVDSRITKEEVSKVINMVLDKSEGGKGEDMRKKAIQLGGLIRGSVEINTGSSYIAMNDFLTNVLSGFKSVII